MFEKKIKVEKKSKLRDINYAPPVEKLIYLASPLYGHNCDNSP